jgi:hypothetical protein
MSELDVILSSAGKVAWFDPADTTGKVAKISGTSAGTFITKAGPPTFAECVVATAPNDVGEHVAAAPDWLDETKDHAYRAWPSAATAWTDAAIEEGIVGPPDNNSGGGSAAGPGADNVTLHFESNGVDIADADVWITSDAEGATTVAGTLQTNSDGNVTFLLDDENTYYVWMQKDGENSIKGDPFTAEAD